MKVKKFLSILLSVVLCLSMMFTLCACGEKDDQNTDNTNSTVSSEQVDDTNNKHEESTLQVDPFWCDTYDWDTVETKTNVDFKMFSLVASPFSPASLDGHLYEISTHGVYQTGETSEVKCELISDLLSGDKYIEPTFSTTSSSSIWFYLDENTSCKMNITSDCEEGKYRANISDAVDSKNYFFYSTYDVQEMLDVNVEITNSKDETPLLEKLIEKFGKPEIKEHTSMNTRDDSYALNQIFYELRWVYEDYTVSVLVNEKCGAYSGGNTYHEVEVSNSMVFTNVSWQKYLAKEANNS